MIDLSIPWVLLRVRDQLFGVPATNIREMAEMPPVTHVPNMPEYVMGLVSMRGQVTPCIDLRRRLGVPTADQDLKRLTDELEKVERDHRQLAETLESAVRSGHAGTVDTQSCAFHEWLGQLQTKNPLVRLQLKKLEGPHSQLHAAAAHVAELAGTDPGEANSALRRFLDKDLAAFTKFTPQVRERLIHAHRQIVVVFTFDGLSLGAAVDEVESIERLKNGSIEELPANLQGLKSKLTRMVGRRTRDDEIVLILEIEELFRGNGQEPVHGDWMEQAAETTLEQAAETNPGPDLEPALEPAPVAATDLAESSAAAVPVSMAATVISSASPVCVAATPVPRYGYADGLDDRAWCGDVSGNWVQADDGGARPTDSSWSRDEREGLGSSGGSWR